MVKRKYSVLQVADLNRGAFGFVQLAKDLETGEQVAIKFIERGDKVRATSPPAGPQLSPLTLHDYHTRTCPKSADQQVCGEGDHESQAAASPTHC